MKSTQQRMIAVALIVCLFAVGMAGLLNYYKYRGTADRIIQERLLVTGQSIKHSIQSSLALDLQLANLGALPAMLERERDADTLIEGIDVFDAEGRPLYSTDAKRQAVPVPAQWLAAARKAGNAGWQVRDGVDSVAGLSIENNFGLTVGHLAVRYSDVRIRQANQFVARQLLLQGVVIYIVAALSACLALTAVMRGLSRDVAEVEKALRSPQPTRGSTAVQVRGRFGAALHGFLENTRRAQAELAHLRGVLQRGSKP